MTKTIFIYRDHPTLQGLVNAANHVCDIFEIEPVSVDQFHSNISKYSQCDVIFEAWLDCYPQLLDLIRGRKFVRWQSPSTQMELSPGGIEFQVFNDIINLKNNKVIDAVFVSDEGLYRSLNPFVDWFPNIFSTSTNYKYSDFVSREGVGLFMTYTPRKNLFCNVLAANLLNKDLHFSSHFDAQFKSLLSLMKIKFISHNSSDKHDYHSILSKLSINLQVTLSESLNYGIIDSLLCGTPVISGFNNPLNGFNREFDRLCLVSRVDNPVEIKNRATAIIESTSLHHDAVGYGIEAINAFYKKSKECIGELLQKNKLI